MKLLYFAWMRERLGRDEETIVLPSDVRTVGELLDHLRGRGHAYAQALADPRIVRVAINHTYAKLHDPVRDADEVAIFPPVTGG